MNQIITTFLLIILLSGCATYHVRVDSINAPESNAKTKYILYPGDKNVAPTDLQFQEYSRYVDKALRLKGFTRAADFDDANMLVFIFYGISDPQVTQSAMVLPMWGQTGIASANTFGTLNTFGKMGTYQGTTTYKPSYGFTGFQAVPVANTLYSKMIILYAIDFEQYKEAQNVTQLWKTTLTSIGTSGDLRGFSCHGCRCNSIFRYKHRKTG